MAEMFVVFTDIFRKVFNIQKKAVKNTIHL